MTKTPARPGEDPRHSKFSLNCRGRLLDLEIPVVMGILNLTPDSFYDGGKTTETTSVLKRAELMLDQGAAILDLGAVSSRPGAESIELHEERSRLIPHLKSIRREFPDALISVDTWRSEIADESADEGASIINDISGGQLDPQIVDVAIRHGMPYVLMHMPGTPQTMQSHARYENVALEVMQSIQGRMRAYRLKGLRDIIIDPGFGFGKTVSDNFRLLSGLNTFRHLKSPVLVGLSRKSMIHRTLQCTPEEALNGTTALNMIALMNGASILRVHDVREARECIHLYQMIQHSKTDRSL